VTVAQAYDWMWRHYRYRPLGGARSFTDTLGRHVSHDALRAAIRAGRATGIATLAYGSVYGAEREYIDRHPDERVFDDQGQPLSLGGTFFINDLRPGRPWRARLLREYERACRAFRFDGIHMDSYGPPYEARAADGARVDFRALYPGLINEAASRVASVNPGARVLFNCVEGFPLESVAPAGAAALYLELWPPDDRFGDVVRWIDRARALSGGRAVVIAAYAAALKDLRGRAGRVRAFESSVLLSSVVTAAGAYHHTLAEGGRLLTEGYYPAAVAMTRSETDELRAMARFSARYLHLLSGPDQVRLPTRPVELVDADGRPVPTSDEPVAGAVWLRATDLLGVAEVLHLIDLRGQEDDHWTTPSQPAGVSRGLHLRWPGAEALLAASPWSGGANLRAVIRARDGAWRLPAFRRWLMVASWRSAAAPGAGRRSHRQ
jgi:dextranase